MDDHLYAYGEYITRNELIQIHVQPNSRAMINSEVTNLHSFRRTSSEKKCREGSVRH